MARMPGRRPALASLVLVAAALANAETPRSLTHRVWLLGGIPDQGTLAVLRAAGVDGVVVPVGSIELAGGGAHFSLAPLPDFTPLAGWSVTGLVWVNGGGRPAGDPATLAAQLVPVQRSLPGSAGLLFAARQPAPGLVAFAAGVAEHLRQRLELALPAPALAEVAGEDGWRNVHAVAIAFGNPPALGFPSSTLQDDLSALERLDAHALAYRVVLVVAPLAVPPPGPGGVSLAVVAGAETAAYRPGARGDTFVLRKPVDWGGVTVAADRSITVETVDTARYDRDLGLLLRPARPLLEGWDTAGLPAPAPALGMSREAFFDYLTGGSPNPRPEVQAEWVGGATLRVALVNPTDQASAVATTGNWAELRFAGTEVGDVQLGDFAGMEYGRPERGLWKGTVARDASALRLYLTFLAPRARTGGCVIRFLSSPRSVSAGWGLRLGDGREIVGPMERLSLTSR